MFRLHKISCVREFQRAGPSWLETLQAHLVLMLGMIRKPLLHNLNSVSAVCSEILSIGDK